MSKDYSEKITRILGSNIEDDKQRELWAFGVTHGETVKAIDVAGEGAVAFKFKSMIEVAVHNEKAKREKDYNVVFIVCDDHVFTTSSKVALNDLEEIYDFMVDHDVDDFYIKFVIDDSSKKSDQESGMLRIVYVQPDEVVGAE